MLGLFLANERVSNDPHQDNLYDRPICQLLRENYGVDEYGDECCQIEFQSWHT